MGNQIPQIEEGQTTQWQIKKNKKTRNDQQNPTQKTKDDILTITSSNTW